MAFTLGSNTAHRIKHSRLFLQYNDHCIDETTELVRPKDEESWSNPERAGAVRSQKPLLVIDDILTTSFPGLFPCYLNCHYNP